ncbi:nitroreductase [Pantoea sp. T14]|jgi:nitroreductase|uniref:nitroreductase n=1 Tax=Pantoea sp. T14 TaxID=3085685 RepID=UPI002FCAB6B6
MSSREPSFHEVVKNRHSARAFLPSPIPNDVLYDILHEAQCAPSNCNTQPWSLHIVAGEKLNELSHALTTDLKVGSYSLDFTFDKEAYPNPFRQRASEQGRSYYQALGVARGDNLSRSEVVERNVKFFGAPHVALLFIPAVGDNVRVASDAGMYAQTFLLSLEARGYAGVPQAVLSYFAQTVRRILNIPENFKLLYGISFGIPDKNYPSLSYREGRVSVEDSVIWHR